MVSRPEDVSREWLRGFCARWKIREFALFGSVARREAGPDSDVDVLVSFEAGARWGLWAFIEMQDQIESSFGRKVHLVSRRGIERSRNHVRREEILNSAEVLHAAS